MVWIQIRTDGMSKLRLNCFQRLSADGSVERENREFDQGFPIAHAVTMQKHQILASPHLID